MDHIQIWRMVIFGATGSCLFHLNGPFCIYHVITFRFYLLIFDWPSCLTLLSPKNSFLWWESTQWWKGSHHNSKWWKIQIWESKNYYAVAFMTSSGVIRLVVNGLAELQFTTNYWDCRPPSPKCGVYDFLLAGSPSYAAFILLGRPEIKMFFFYDLLFNTLWKWLFLNQNQIQFHINDNSVPVLGREFLSKHVALKVAHSGHLNVLFFLTCTDSIGSCV